MNKGAIFCLMLIGGWWEKAKSHWQWEPRFSATASIPTCFWFDWNRQICPRRLLGPGKWARACLLYSSLDLTKKRLKNRKKCMQCLPCDGFYLKIVDACAGAVRATLWAVTASNTTDRANSSVAAERTCAAAVSSHILKTIPRVPLSQPVFLPFSRPYAGSKKQILLATSADQKYNFQP